MAESSWPNTPHNGRAVTEAEFEQLVQGGEISGLLGALTQTTAVYADGIAPRQVFVRATKSGKTRGFFWKNDAVVVTHAIAANVGALRYDLVVMRLTRATWEIETDVLTGVSGGTIPTPTQDVGTIGVYEVPLAVVTVGTGVASIAANMVADVAPYILRPPVGFTTASGRNAHPRAAGQLIYSSADTDQYMWDDGLTLRPFAEEWGEIGLTAGDAGWSVGSSTVHRRNGWINLEIGILRTGGSIGQGSILGIIPDNYRPASTHDIVAVVHGFAGIRSVLLAVTASGQLRFQIGNAIDSGYTAYATTSYPAA